MMDDNENPFARDEALQERVREYRREQADKAISNLSAGNFANVASAFKNDDEQYECVICTSPFADEENVTELKCHAKHIFHAECLKPWLENKMSCPICREEVRVSE